MRLGFGDDVSLIAELEVNDGGQEAAGFPVYLHRNGSRRDDVSTSALSDARSVASSLKQRLIITAAESQDLRRLSGDNKRLTS